MLDYNLYYIACFIKHFIKCTGGQSNVRRITRQLKIKGKSKPDKIKDKMEQNITENQENINCQDMK